MPADRRSDLALTHVALLRGINVGGKRIVPMKALAAIFEQAGCGAVQTYIQSGNVLFAAGADLARTLAKELPRCTGREFGFEPVVVIRSRKEMADVLKANPFARPGVNAATLHVGFLAERPTAGQVASLDPDRSPGDSFSVRGSEIYLHTPNGMARTKLTSAYLDATLGTTCTVRNWNTVTKLGALLGCA